MPREIQNPILNDRGEEEHPAFGRVVVNRVQSTPGAVLFDSDIRHGEYVRLSVHGARRQRDLNQDWIYADEEIIEISMSLAQWASMVSSFGNGGGVSCTITERRKYDGEYLIPALPFQSRMQVTTDETLGAADKAFEAIKIAYEAYVEDKKVGKLKDLGRTIDQATGNVEFATKQLSRHVEKTVQHARADLEAIVNQHARAVGIDPASVVTVLSIEDGS